MDIQIRQETENDIPQVQELIEKSFQKEPFSDNREHLLVAQLRQSNNFIPELSLVAELNKHIVGYILLSKIEIAHFNHRFSGLALAPVAVLPEYQGMKIGSLLILEAHRIARKMSYERIVVLGHADYYPRFGYKEIDSFNIQLPFKAPKENCMIIGLNENSLKNVQGQVIYPKEFL
jgi:predicted N-acetyltransferase YhbS